MPGHVGGREGEGEGGGGKEKGRNGGRKGGFCFPTPPPNKIDLESELSGF